MKFFSSELAHSYETYSFGYCNYCVCEPGDKLVDIYNLGFLPYSGKIDITDTFYMSRSGRSLLKNAEPTSENRRVLRKFESQFERKSTPFSEFNHRDEHFLNFCTEYFAKRHGPYVMPRERLLGILEMNLISHIVVYSENGESKAYVFEVNDEHMTHFWFSFYDLSLTQQSLGMWLMLDSLWHAKRTGKQHFYVGTVYGEKALYKTNIPALEYWNGSKWVADVKKLKARAREDEKRIVHLQDEWKK